MAVYTAGRAADVVGINSVVNGWTSWALADGVNVIRSGNYAFTDAVWSAP